MVILIKVTPLAAVGPVAWDSEAPELVGVDYSGAVPAAAALGFPGLAWVFSLRFYQIGNLVNARLPSCSMRSL